MKSLVAIGMFSGITFVFTVIFAIFQQIFEIDANTISLPQFGPGFAAIVMLTVFRRIMFRSIVFRNDVRFVFTFKGIHFLKYLGAIGIPLVVPIVLFQTYNHFISPLSIPSTSATSLMIIFVGMLLGAFGEELGWRGYAQNLLDRHLNGLVAFLVVGVLWGLWHVGNYQHGPIYMLFFVLSTIGYSAVMAWLLQGTNYNVVLAGLFHFSVNAGFYLLKDVLTDVRLIALNGIIWTVAAVIIVTLNREQFLRIRPKNVVVSRTSWKRPSTV